MNQIKPNVSSQTTIVGVNGATFDIDTFYDQLIDCDGNPSDLPLILSVLIASVDSIVNSSSIQQGNLCIMAKDNIGQISFWIDSDGNFFINSDDADRYTIDSNGHLIYTLCP